MRALSVLLRGTAAALGAFWIKGAAAESMGGHKNTHPLGATFFTRAPLRDGAYMAKLSLAPGSSSLTALMDRPLSDELADDENRLREAVKSFFDDRTGTWELRAQLTRALDKMPIEDHSVQWSDDDSPYVAVARVRIEPQLAWRKDRSHVVDDGLSFNPWQGSEAHRPLGGVMRARKQVYSASVAFRGTAKDCPMREPQTVDQLATLATG